MMPEFDFTISCCWKLKEAVVGDPKQTTPLKFYPKDKIKNGATKAVQSSPYQWLHLLFFLHPLKFMLYPSSLILLENKFMVLSWSSFATFCFDTNPLIHLSLTSRFKSTESSWYLHRSTCICLVKSDFHSWPLN